MWFRLHLFIGKTIAWVHTQWFHYRFARLKKRYGRIDDIPPEAIREILGPEFGKEMVKSVRLTSALEGVCHQFGLEPTQTQFGYDVGLFVNNALTDKARFAEVVRVRNSANVRHAVYFVMLNNGDIAPHQQQFYHNATFDKWLKAGERAVDKNTSGEDGV